MNGKLLGFLIGFLAPALALGAVNEADRANLGSTKNFMYNGGAENSTAGWSKSAGTFTTATANSYDGSRYFNWVPAAAANTVTGGAIAIPTGMQGKPGVISCMVQTTGSLHKLQVTDGTNPITDEVPSNIIQGSADWQPVTRNFVFPTSGSIYPRVLAGDTATIKWDSCVLGDARRFNLQQISQTVFVGSATYAVNPLCDTWARTSTTLGPFAADTDCIAPTVIDNPGPGVISTVDADLPQFTVNNLPPGRYKVTISGGALVAGNTRSAFAISDGTTVTGHVAGNSSAYAMPFTMVGWFNYPSGGSPTFQLFGSAATGSVTLQTVTGGGPINFSIERFPSGSDTAYTPTTGPGASWSGYHGSDCSWNKTGSTYGDLPVDAACTFAQRSNTNFGTVTGANTGPQITLNFPRLGKFKVCAYPKSTNDTTNQATALQLVDGSGTFIADNYTFFPGSNVSTSVPLCGDYQATTLGSTTLKIQAKLTGGTGGITAPFSMNAIEWSIFQLDAGQAAPVIIANSRGSISLSTGNGHGSTNTKIRRFSSIRRNDALWGTLNQSATLGDSITITETGIYAISYTDRNSAGNFSYGISVDTTQPTVSISSIPEDENAQWASQTANLFSSVSVTLPLIAGQVVRAHTDGTLTETANLVKFKITQVSR